MEALIICADIRISQKTLQTGSTMTVLAGPALFQEMETSYVPIT